jgi:hypothetical protein
LPRGRPEALLHALFIPGIQWNGHLIQIEKVAQTIANDEIKAANSAPGQLYESPESVSALKGRDFSPAVTASIATRL